MQKKIQLDIAILSLKFVNRLKVTNFMSLITVVLVLWNHLGLNEVLASDVG